MRVVQKKTGGRGCMTLLAVLVLLTASGCATLSAEPLSAIQVETKSEGSLFEVEGALVPSQRLVSALRKAGAGADTEIVILVPPGASTTWLARLTADLRRAGFRKILYARPRHVSVQTSETSISPSR